MNDSELSLAVIQIMEPNSAPSWKWMFQHAHKYDLFDHTTDDALGKMCVWLANNRSWVLENDLGILIESVTEKGLQPHRAIAEAIVEIGGKDEI